jgi:methyl-accepting chemotaxis protein
MSDLPIETALTLERAFAAHQQWKAKLQESVTARTTLDVSTIRRDDCCELGKWLHTDARASYGHKPEFKNLLAKHASFHLVASVVAGIINTKQYEEAAAMLQDYSLFSTASADVGMAIMALKKASAS